MDPSTSDGDRDDRLDRARNEFRSAWREGRRPRIEDFLGTADDLERASLLRAMIATELEFRKAAGESPTIDEYLARFSTELDVVRAAFTDDFCESDDPTPDALPSSLLPTAVNTERGSDGEAPTRTLSAGECGLFSLTGVNDSGLPERVGPYHSLRFLGEGGFGRVYYSRHPVLNRDVAIKVARHGLLRSREREETLLDEARLAAGLKHPAIVSVYEVGRLDDGKPYVVLEYIDGRTLSALLKDERPSFEELARLLARVAEAAHHAHEAGLVHRDLTPANILIDRRGEPHVTDFGLAVDEDLQRLRTGQIAGTPAYMAPEQVLGETHRLDRRTDVWAIGVILYRGLTRRLPFTGSGRDEVFDAILRCEPVPPRQIVEEIPLDLERICLTCLSRRQSDRYLRASDLADDLHNWLALVGASAVEKAASGSASVLRPDPVSKASATLVPKGLRAFGKEDARGFLDLLPGRRGRDGLPASIRFWKSRIEDVSGDLAFSVGLLYGTSGGGKSSLVRAGLLPRLDGRVRTIFLEATPRQTEQQLMAALQRAFPWLPEGCKPAEALATIREVGLGHPDAKLLLVFDQFEQWLQAHPDDPQAELIRALRQCEGRRLQALLLVRDDFWMAITRTFKALEIPLVEGGNSAAVEPFDAAHARKVLIEFGRASGRLADHPGPLDADAGLFLDQAIAGMTQPNGGITPVHLSLVAEMVRHRDWTPDMLRDLGGVEGIGLAFLEESFDSSSAPPAYRMHRKAAQAVLQRLLPIPTSVLRGGLRTARDLRAVSGYDDQPEEFAELLRILDHDLRLITPVDPDGAQDEEGPGLEIERGEACYQLAHDYLIGPIREWVERKERATRSGRARLRLALIAESWADRPSAHRLASPLELGGILWHTRRKTWSDVERRMIEAAIRHYLVRVVAAGAALLVLGLVIHRARDQERATTALRLALQADYQRLPDLLPELDSHRESLRDDLERLENDPKTRGREREAAILLLYRDWPTAWRAARLRDRLGVAGPVEAAMIREALATAPETAGIAELRRALLDDSTDPAARLRFAGALAALGPVDGTTWASTARALAEALIAEDRRRVSDWLATLAPAFPLLVPELTRICGDAGRDPTTRSNAAEALAEALIDRDDLAGLARAVIEARPDTSLILLHELEHQRRRAPALDYLRGQLVDRPDEPPGDALADRKAATAITLAVLGEPEPLWSALEHRGDPSLRTRTIGRIATLALAPGILSSRNVPGGLDPAVRQAMLMAWAETPTGALSEPNRADAIENAFRLFLDDPDPGVHSAAKLLLRRWGRDDLLASAGDPARPREQGLGGGGRSWEKGPNGHTLVLLPGPLEFRMGSPEGEPGRAPIETPHHRRIARSIAVATTEVTVEQYRAFKPNYAPDRRYPREPGSPAGDITWYEALDYCDWLSEEAGIPPGEWCYPKANGRRMAPEVDPLKRTGFRLPTEAEWEYLCRAGTETSRFYGTSDDPLGRFAWTWLNWQGRICSVGRLLPNEFGLFDTLGGVWEWTQGGAMGTDFHSAYPGGPQDPPAPDAFPGMPDNKNDWRDIRGGSFSSSPNDARSAQRKIIRASYKHGDVVVGFRVVRTLPESPSPTVP